MHNSYTNSFLTLSQGIPLTKYCEFFSLLKYISTALFFYNAHSLRQICENIFFIYKPTMDTSIFGKSLHLLHIYLVDNFINIQWLFSPFKFEINTRIPLFYSIRLHLNALCTKTIRSFLSYCPFSSLIH